MNDRKYKQIGYMGGTLGKKRSTRPPIHQKPAERVIPRVPEPLKARHSFKCASCGATQMIIEETVLDETCASCQAPIHACVNCGFFDTAAPSECTQPIDAPVEKKRAANTCPLFKPKITVDITVGSQKRAPDARAAFDALFKK